MNEQKKDEVVVKKNHKWIIPIVALFVILFVALIIFFYKINSNGKDNRLQEQLDLGAKYLSELDYAQAIVAYDTAIQIDPMSVDAYLGLASVYEAQGEYEKAIAILQEGYDKTSDDVFLDKIEQLKNILNSISEENSSDNFLSENETEEYVLIDENGDGKHDPDVEALNSIINEQVAFGALVDENLDSEQYVWLNGRLIEIHWVDMKLSKEISFSELANLEKIECCSLDYHNVSYQRESNYSYLEKIDVSNNFALKYLDCGGNSLIELDVSNNIELEYLSCYNNMLSELSINNNIKLKKIICFNNQLSNILLNNNLDLTLVSCSMNRIQTIDVTQNVNLEYLICNTNQIDEIDLSNYTNLNTLQCDSTVNVIGYNGIRY